MKLLRSLGYRVSTEDARGNDYFAVAFDSRNKAQIGTAEWITDYPTASGFFNPLFTCASFLPRQPEQRERRRVLRPAPRPPDRAEPSPSRPRTPTPPADSGSSIDRQTVDQAPWVPLVNPNVVDVLSKRVGNYQYSPAGWGC